jgi:hypothetical protein
MSDDSPERVDLDASLPEPWSPSPSLRARLYTGAWAVMVAGGLTVAEAAVELSQGKVQGFAPAHALGWATLLPLYLVLWTFQDLAREVRSGGLRRSSLGLFWTFCFLQVLEFADLKILPVGWEVALVVAVAIGMIGLLASLSISEGPAQAGPNAGQSPSETPPAAPADAKSPAEAPPDSSAKSKVGIIGGLVVGLLLLIKALAKGNLFVKVVAFRFLGRMAKKLNLDTAEALAFVALLLLGIGFWIWFAVSKIRLRHKLGGAAALAGWAEILLAVVLAGFALFSSVTLSLALEQPGLALQDLERLEQQTLASVLVAGMAVSIIYSGVLIYFFVSLRNRFPPDLQTDADW